MTRILYSRCGFFFYKHDQNLQGLTFRKKLYALVFYCRTNTISDGVQNQARVLKQLPSHESKIKELALFIRLFPGNKVN